MFLRAGDRVIIRDLLYGIAVSSGNEAFVALAKTLSGSVEAFVEEMNREAAALGLTSASFADPHGLFADNVMSALDVARLSETLEPEIGPSDVFPL
jgi:D-alanyl-D-alanine carboxypeptidase